jgi:hypothetical protein
VAQGRRLWDPWAWAYSPDAPRYLPLQAAFPPHTLVEYDALRVSELVAACADVACGMYPITARRGLLAPAAGERTDLIDNLRIMPRWATRAMATHVSDPGLAALAAHWLLACQVPTKLLMCAVLMGGVCNREACDGREMPLHTVVRCPGCCIVHYCSSACQHADWVEGGHQHACDPLWMAVGVAAAHPLQSRGPGAFTASELTTQAMRAKGAAGVAAAARAVARAAAASGRWQPPPAWLDRVVGPAAAGDELARAAAPSPEAAAAAAAAAAAHGQGAATAGGADSDDLEASGYCVIS